MYFEGLKEINIVDINMTGYLYFRYLSNRSEKRDKNLNTPI